MSKNLFVTSTEPRSGKSLVSLGLMELLIRNINRVAFFRPLILSNTKGKKNNDIDLFATHFNLNIPYEKMYAYTTTEANSMIAAGRNEELLEGILNKYNEIEKDHDFVLCEGTEFEGSSASFEFDINSEISNNLGCPVLLVGKADNKNIDETIRSINMYNESFIEEGCNVIATIINRVSPEHSDRIITSLKKDKMYKNQLVYTIPDNKTLGNPTMGEIARLLNAKVLYGEEQLGNNVYSYAIAAMQLRHFLDRVHYGTLIITPGDRADIIVACMSIISSTAMPYISGIVLTGGLEPENSVRKLIEGYDQIIPVLSVKEDTFPAAKKISDMHSVIAPDDIRKINHALGVFEKNIDIDELSEKIIKTQTEIITPKMFEHRLIQKAKAHKQHIILPEGEDQRILQATEALLRRDVVDITLLGNKRKIKDKITQLGLNIENTNIIDPQNSEYFDDYVKTYFELRGHKGITIDNAGDIMADVNFFATMMIYKGHADGMVSGARHTTGNTIRPAFQIIKTKPGCSIVSSVFLMCLKDRVLVYGDCAINPNPDSRQLAEIAIASAITAEIFGIDPKVAMLSYSTGESGKGEDVDNVRSAVAIARDIAEEKHMKLILEGPIQYDAAVDSKVAEAKMPDSKVAGNATVLIFPDLNTGNNTYKAVQRSSGAVAIGPVLQGLNKPVNDLSRGCLVTDIVNTVAITAIQAQAEKGLL